MIALLLASLLIFTPQDDPIIGTWLGSIQTPTGDIRILFHVSRDSGQLSATLDSPDQGAFGIQIDEVSFTGGAFHLAINSIGGGYDGTMDDEGILNGFWKQGGGTIPLRLEKTDKTPQISRPQEPQPPFPYKEEKIRFLNAADRISLAATLLIPEGEGPFPAVAFCTGSGPQDRDETIFGHKPFWVLADHLSRNGIVTLRYDDRGVGDSGGDFLTATSVEFSRDLEAAVTYLEKRSEVDAHRIGAVGHSEGGMVAPMIANGTPGLDFAVLLAPPGVLGETIIVSQSEAIARLSGASETDISSNSDLQRSLFAVLKESLEPDAEREKMRGLLADVIGDNQTAIDAQIGQITAPWMRSFLVYDPKPALVAMQCPALALIGEKDLQVLAEVNIPAIEEAFAENPNDQLTVREIPGANHLFQIATSGLPAEYAKIDETISPNVLKEISDWILSVVGN